MKLKLVCVIVLMLLAIAASSIQINTQEQLEKIYFSKFTEPMQGYWQPIETLYDFKFNSKYYRLDRFPLQSTFFKLAGHQYEIKHYEINDWVEIKALNQNHLPLGLKPIY